MVDFQKSSCNFSAPRRPTRKRQDFANLDATDPKRAFASERPCATRLELKFTEPRSTSILNLYGARVGCPAWAFFRFRGFAPVAGPNCGGVRPYKATPWVTLLVYISNHVWLERFLAVPQPFLSRLCAVSRRFSAKKRLATYSLYGKWRF
jgi:hypothetical protein